MINNKTNGNLPHIKTGVNKMKNDYCYYLCNADGLSINGLWFLNHENATKFMEMINKMSINDNQPFLYYNCIVEKIYVKHRNENFIDIHPSTGEILTF